MLKLNAGLLASMVCFTVIWKCLYVLTLWALLKQSLVHLQPLMGVLLVEPGSGKLCSTLASISITCEYHKTPSVYLQNPCIHSFNLASNPPPEYYPFHVNPEWNTNYSINTIMYIIYIRPDIHTCTVHICMCRSPYLYTMSKKCKYSKAITIWEA